MWYKAYDPITEQSNIAQIYDRMPKDTIEIC